MKSSKKRGFFSELRGFLSDLMEFLSRHQSSPTSDRMRLNKYLQRDYEPKARLKRDRERNERIKRDSRRR